MLRGNINLMLHATSLHPQTLNSQFSTLNSRKNEQERTLAKNSAHRHHHPHGHCHHLRGHLVHEPLTGEGIKKEGYPPGAVPSPLSFMTLFHIIPHRCNQAPQGHRQQHENIPLKGIFRINPPPARLPHKVFTNFKKSD